MHNASSLIMGLNLSKNGNVLWIWQPFQKEQFARTVHIPYSIYDYILGKSELSRNRVILL